MRHAGIDGECHDVAAAMQLEQHAVRALLRGCDAVDRDAVDALMCDRSAVRQLECRRSCVRRGMEECLHLLRDVCLLHLVREDKTVRGLLVRCSECCLRSPCEDGCKNGGRKDLPNGTDLHCFISFSQKRVTMNMQRIL